ncbi:MAG: hypothetical protein ABJB70_00985, partial [Candidatus Udaeobacter sp.]
NTPRKRAFPQKEKTQYDQKHVDQSVAQQQHIQNAARIFAENLYEIRKPRMILFEAAQLVRLQQGERCFHSGKKRGAEDQNGDGAQHNGQSKSTHLRGTKPHAPCVAFPARGTGEGGRGPSEELVVRGLLIL